jgi:oligopeptide/dipeptide ABC transporter ATP-binding protein
LDGQGDGMLVEISDLVVNFYTYQGIVQAIEGVDLVIRKGETLGLVGETGCGKSVTASAIMKLILSPPGKIEGGHVYFMEPPEVRAKRVQLEADANRWYRALSEDERKKLVASYGLRWTGFKRKPKPVTTSEVAKTVPPEKAPSHLVDRYLATKLPQTAKEDKAAQDAIRRSYDLLTKSTKYMQKIRGRFISMIFQEPTSALNPVFTAGDQIAEVILLHRKTEMATRALTRLQKEQAHIRRTKTDWKQEANAWYERLSDYDRRKMTAAYGTYLSRFRKRGTPRIEAELSEVMPPEHPSENLVNAYLAKRRRPRAWPGDLVPGMKTASSGDDLTGRGRCSVCDAYLDEGDVRCDVCNSEFYGRFSWLVRPLILSTYIAVMQSIKRNPDSKQGLISRIPGLKRYRSELDTEALKEATRMLEVVRIPDPKGVAQRYPFELSGGMQQRVMIAIALACNPKLLIADEPTTALDVTIQGQILKLMRDLKSEYGSSILLITHNLGVVAEMCDRVGVMYAGSMAEIGQARDIFKRPLHPYTTGLMKSVPSIQMEAERLYTIRGSVPNLIYPPNGCRFHPRCDFARGYCTKVRPPMTEIEPGHSVACHMAAKAEGYVRAP